MFAAGASVPYALNDARASTLARDKAFSERALRAGGVAAISGEMFFVTERWADMRAPGREPADALAYAARAAYPLFCKPISGSNGLYAEVVADADAFADYMRRVAREHFAMLAQPFMRGDEHRVFILSGAPLFSYRKTPPCVTGDGSSTLRVLLEAFRRDDASPMRVRDAAGDFASLESVPAVGETLTLEGPANRSAGGGACDLRDGAPEPLARIALAAAGALGLSLAGVDIFDVSPARDLSDLLVIEVNGNPMIETLEEGGRWDLITAIWRANFDAALK